MQFNENKTEEVVFSCKKVKLCSPQALLGNDKLKENLSISILGKEIAIAKATEKIHQEYLNDEYELTSLNDKYIQFPKISDDVGVYSYERKPALLQLHDDNANTKKQNVLAGNDQHSHIAPIFSTQARCNLEKANLQPELRNFILHLLMVVQLLACHFLLLLAIRGTTCYIIC